MDDKEIVLRKKQLAHSKEWKEIKSYQLERVLELSNGSTDPLIIKGMLLNIKETDKWVSNFEKIKAKEIKE